MPNNMGSIPNLPMGSHTMPPIPPMGAGMGGGMPMNIGFGIPPMGSKMISPPIQPMMGQTGPSDIKSKIKSIVKDKQTFDKMDASKAKKFLYEPLRHLAEEAGIPTVEIPNIISIKWIIIDGILSENVEISEIITKYLESPEDFKKKIVQHWKYPSITIIQW